MLEGDPRTQGPRGLPDVELFLAEPAFFLFFFSRFCLHTKTAVMGYDGRSSNANRAANAPPCALAQKGVAHACTARGIRNPDKAGFPNLVKNNQRHFETASITECHTVMRSQSVLVTSARGYKCCGLKLPPGSLNSVCQRRDPDRSLCPELSAK